MTTKKVVAILTKALLVLKMLSGTAWADECIKPKVQGYHYVDYLQYGLSRF